MPDFSAVFQERVPGCGTAWLILGTFVPVWFCGEKESQCVVVVILHRGVSVCHGDGVRGEGRGDRESHVRAFALEF